MGIDLNNGYNDLRNHIGHSIVTVGYGQNEDGPDNVAIECETCGCVLIDFNNPKTHPEDRQYGVVGWSIGDITDMTVLSDDEAALWLDHNAKYIVNRMVEVANESSIPTLLSEDGIEVDYDVDWNDAEREWRGKLCRGNHDELEEAFEAWCDTQDVPASFECWLEMERSILNIYTGKR